MSSLFGRPWMMRQITRHRLKRIRRAALLIVWVSFVVYLFLLTAWTMAPSVADAIQRLGGVKRAPTVLFGTATVALTLIVVVLAVLSFFGWAVVADRVRAEVRRAMGEERQFDLALSRTTDAMMLALVADAMKRFGPDFLLKTAVNLSTRALETVPMMEPRTQEERQTQRQAKNNLAYLLAVLDRREDAVLAVRLAREAWEGYELKSERAEALLTLARVLAKFARVTEDKPLRALTDIKEMLDALAARESLDPFQQQEHEEAARLLEEAIKDEERKAKPPAT